MLKIVTRVFDGKRIVAYDVTDGVKTSRLSKDNVVKLALENRIANVSVDSRYNLIGRGCKLSSIKAVQLKNKYNYIILYHGSKDIVRKPRFGVGNIKNDYGQGFYTTRSMRLASEWAGKNGEEACAYVNEYKLYTDGLIIEDIGGDFMLWVAALAKGREMWKRGSGPKNTSEFIAKYYDNRLDKADVIVGWRADDNLYSVVEDFLLGKLSKKGVLTSLHFGGLGIQYFIKSELAFKRIEFVRSIKVNKTDFYILANDREIRASSLYGDLYSNENKGW
jgi:hypothetical protein